ncbi:MAG: LamG domain-containing protein, partial [Victivallales bacterium]|nr:LamG domain-containing protein [Victivallales bacterium]
IGGGYKNNKAGGASTAIEPETFTKPFTIDMWLKLDPKVDYKYFRDLVGNGADNGPGFRITYYYNQLRVITGDGTTHQAAVVGTKIIIPKDEWFFISMTYSGSELKIYINGKEAMKKEITLTAGKKMFTFGSYKGGMAYPLKGALDNVRIYDKVLEQAEIVAIYEKEVIR